MQGLGVIVGGSLVLGLLTGWIVKRVLTEQSSRKGIPLQRRSSRSQLPTLAAALVLGGLCVWVGVSLMAH